MSAENTLLVDMKQITRDPKLQVRNQVDQKLVRQYATAMSNGAEFPPIHLAEVKGALILVDGWHRQAALHSLGRHEVLAKVTPMTAVEAMREAALANTRHGKPLKPTERRNVFKNFVQGKGHKKSNGSLMSYREIAEALGGHVGHTTIYNWMKKDFPRISKAMGVEAERGKGNGEPPRIDVQGQYRREAIQAFQDTLNMYRLLTCPIDRDLLVEKVTQGLAEMKTYEHWPTDF
ncbi:MAG: ParB N-terminal domain-containing protein [Zoogloeaceae bacterium]|nr:ParB N-terminal domain-containing protein [Zoogloeaceae bacterium]MCW5616591.1 ParB-like nuclease domain-containing protein [Rhodocyclaceae bacterium]